MDFIDACKHGYLDKVISLLDQGADIHANHDLALRWSACSGHLPVVQYLLEQGADIHAENDCALRLSARNGHLPVVQYLLIHGAKIGDMSSYPPYVIAFIDGFFHKVRKMDIYLLSNIY